MPDNRGPLGRMLASLDRSFRAAKESNEERAYIRFHISLNTWKGLLALAELARSSAGEAVDAVVMGFRDMTPIVDGDDFFQEERDYCDAVAVAEAAEMTRYELNVSLPVSSRSFLDAIAASTQIDAGAVFGSMFATMCTMGDGQ